MVSRFEKITMFIALFSFSFGVGLVYEGQKKWTRQKIEVERVDHRMISNPQK